MRGAFDGAPSDDGFLTTREIAEKVGRKSQWVQERLRELQGRGLLEVGRKTLASIDGRAMSVAAYRVKKVTGPAKGSAKSKG